MMAVSSSAPTTQMHTDPNASAYAQNANALAAALAESEAAAAARAAVDAAACAEALPLSDPGDPGEGTQHPLFADGPTDAARDAAVPPPQVGSKRSAEQAKPSTPSDNACTWEPPPSRPRVAATEDEVSGRTAG